MGIWNVFKKNKTTDIKATLPDNKPNTSLKNEAATNILTEHLSDSDLTEARKNEIGPIVFKNASKKKT